MADGDLAASLGWHIPADTDDKRLGAQEIRKALDVLASHVLTFTQPLAQGGTGATTAAGARSALGITASNIPSTVGNVQANLNDLSSRADAAQATANSAIAGALSSDVYGRFIGGAFRSVVVQDDGTLGQRSTSSMRYKAHVRPAPFDWSVLLRDPRAEPVSYVRRAELARVKREGGEPRQEVGWIAERLHELQMPFVGVDAEGRPDVVHYEDSGVAILGALRALTVEVDRLRDRLEKAGL